MQALKLCAKILFAISSSSCCATWTFKAQDKTIFELLGSCHLACSPYCIVQGCKRQSAQKVHICICDSLSGAHAPPPHPATVSDDDSGERSYDAGARVPIY